MADATIVIRELGQQIAQLTVDKTIAMVELAEAQGRIAELESATPVESAKASE